MKPEIKTTVSFKVRARDKKRIMKFVRKWMVNKGYKLYGKNKKGTTKSAKE